MFLVKIALGLAALYLVAMPSTAARADDSFDCGYGIADGSLPDEGVAGCTRFMQRGGQSRESLSWAYGNRCIHYRNLKSYDLGLADCNKSLELDPRNPKAYTARGLIYQGKNLDDLALADFNRAVELAPMRATTYANRGIVWKHKGNIPAALADANKAIDMDSKRETNAYLVRGWIYLGAKEYRKALDDFNTYISNHLHDRRGYLGRVALYEEEKKYDLAIGDLSKAIDLDYQKADELYLQRARMHLAKKDSDKAIDDFTYYIAGHPEEKTGYQARASVYGQEGKYALAIRDYGKLIELFPADGEAYNGRAWDYFKSGEPAPGLPDADKALQYNPKDGDSWDTRAHILEALGRKQEAIADYKKALALNPNLEGSKKGLQRLGVAP